MPVLAAKTTDGTVSPQAGPDELYYRTANFWKRFSVFLSIALSIAALIVSAYASLKHPNTSVLGALAVSGVAINSISVALSALTSLDWTQQSTHDRVFAQHLCKVAHVHEGEQIVIRSNRGGDEKPSGLLSGG